MMGVGEQTFNGSLETGIRATAFLTAAYPRTLDLQRLVAFDYLVSRTGQFRNAPKDLHPPTPISSPPTEVRRGIVQDALKLMLSRNLVEQLPTVNGIEYLAGEAAEFLMSSLDTPYTTRLRRRATWLVEEFGDLDTDRFDLMMRSLFERWAEEFEEGYPVISGKDT